ncbi:phage major capsid protein [Fimbriiglobus ruber]|uniref:Phage capsid-like C-terminal domain-containing protein n=1 Tax=Fimbriiglobus ruber TaxID=1908690 RepID=A0A225DAI2_9BACT|nr:phage major capsid protein [Fimbriiglobus ruber]OWK34306.1 hypothetical protein FRUB_10277 [Fimbriiglobus ruber]
MAEYTAAELISRVKKAEEKAESAERKLREMEDRPAPGAGPGNARFTKGHSGTNNPDSKRFSMTSFAINGLARNDVSAAKFEMDTIDRFSKALHATGQGLVGAPAGAKWLPLRWDGFDHVAETDDGKFAKAVLQDAAVRTGGSYDPEEAEWLARRGIIRKSATQATGQSAFIDNLGGSLVAPPVQGEVIPLIRPQAAFLAAGAQSMTLPPSGRYVRPRLTRPTVASALGEGVTTPATTVGTGQMTLTAKKISGAMYISEEATNYTSGTIDTIAQNDLGITLGLKADAFAFYGTGGTSIPAGLTSAEYAAAVINVETAYPSGKGIGANGNTLLPQYGDLLPVLIEERSFNLDATKGTWIMRPTALASAFGVRADAVTAGDGAGPLVDLLRRFSDGGPQQWRGRRVVQSTNINGARTKGSGTNLSDAFYGMWNHAIMATYGALMFTQGHDGFTFLNGQYIVKGTMYGDVGFEYPEAFLWLTNVIGSQGLI